MHRWCRGFASLVGSLILMAAAVYPSAAATSGPVAVSGAVVQAPLSMTISPGSISFGNIDSRGTPQTGTILATGDATSGGAYWFTTSSLTLTVSSPGVWSSATCLNSGAIIPDGGIAIIPQSNLPVLGQGQTVFDTAKKAGATCSSPNAWIEGQSATDSVSHVLHLGTFVPSGATPKGIDATITFSVSIP